LEGHGLFGGSQPSSSSSSSAEAAAAGLEWGDVPPARERRDRRSRDASVTMARLAAVDLEKLDPHVMVRPEPYAEPEPALDAQLQGDPSAQPFRVEVHPDVAFICDFHAHLADAEVIGLLGGYWDRENRVLFVQAPFPCRSTDRSDDGATDVEMDPASEIQIREIISGHGMQVVGWYHSHPKFQPDPSVTDIVNQKNYQALFEDPLAGIAPFVGLIVGTYDPALPRAASLLKYFHVRSQRRFGAARDAAPVAFPMAIKATVRSFKRGLSEAEREARREKTLSQLHRRHEALHGMNAGGGGGVGLSLSSSGLGGGGVRAHPTEAFLPAPSEADEAASDAGVAGDAVAALLQLTQLAQRAHPSGPSAPGAYSAAGLLAEAPAAMVDDAPIAAADAAAAVGAYAEDHTGDAHGAAAVTAVAAPGAPFAPRPRWVDIHETVTRRLEANAAAAAAEAASLSDASDAAAAVAMEKCAAAASAAAVVGAPGAGDGAVTGGGADAGGAGRELGVAAAASLAGAASSAAAAAGQLAAAHQARLRCVCSSVVPLGQYYAKFPQRAEWGETWRQLAGKEVKKGEKLQRSLAVWLPKMDLDEASAGPFLGDLLSLVFACWREHEQAGAASSSSGAGGRAQRGGGKARR